MEVYSVVDLSEMLQVSEKTIRRYIKDGRLKGKKIARKWLIHEDAVRQFLGVSEQSQNNHACCASKGNP
jgi:excisionase family DNA binding protein